jgi:hypothetical protein
MSTASSVSTALVDTFSPFTRLPTELRILIWNFASTPRTLTIRKHFSHDQDTQYLYSPNSVPATLHTCRESRYESLYTTSFTMENSPRYIWINFNLDTIKMPDYALRHIKLAEISQITRLILEVDCICDFSAWDIDDIELIENLAELTILSVCGLSLWPEYIESILWNQEYAHNSWREWVPPMIRVIEMSSGEEINSTNMAERSAILLQRTNSENGYGFGPDVSMEEERDRHDRRKLELNQRQKFHGVYEDYE